MIFMFIEIFVQDLVLMLVYFNGDCQLIDVWEFYEVEIVVLLGFEILFLSEFVQWFGIIWECYDGEKEIVVLCYYGICLDQMVYWLVD